MLPHFHTLYFETTRRCNLACQYCSAGSNKPFDASLEMTFDQIVQRVLIPAYELGTRTIEFSGGEFLLREDAFEILSKANEIGIKIIVVSNGTTLDEKTISRLKALLGGNILISLGINSFDTANIATRDIDAERVKEVISLLERQHVNINLCVTFGKFNAHSVADTLKNIRELKLPFNRIPFVPRNCMNKENMLDKETLRNFHFPAILKDYHGYVSYTPFFLPVEDYAQVSGQNQQEHRVPTNPSIGCFCGSFYGINAEGEVAPCPLVSDHFSGGNVLKEDLKDILFKSELFQKIIDREKLGGKCGKCKFNFTCGGCRAMAYYHNGDLFGEDPTCFIDDLSEDEIREIEKETTKQFKNYVRMSVFGGTYENKEETE
jgi:AdoMet-dependent heme synthase